MGTDQTVGIGKHVHGGEPGVPPETLVRPRLNKVRLRISLGGGLFEDRQDDAALRPFQGGGKGRVAGRIGA